ncbi:polyphenol oxidase family protein [Treponema parvum]|uniref:Polyphenol oxidase family protein n=1 Tax=Treponema parvum TaxID=138851 RepID=A0A975F5H9_9SPIR|nr:polyphenol oxidase family protein [Treponema parvum]QTQ14349.1 polyphenol oxidase family protein [Treponema parvum]
MKKFSLCASVGDYAVFHFICGGKELSGGSYPVCGMSLLRAGSMRFRWNEKNKNRDLFFSSLCGKENLCRGGAEKTEGGTSETADIPEMLYVPKGRTENFLPIPVPLELVHSRDVIILGSGKETQGRQADGMLTKNKALLPSVTVADCVPVFLYDRRNGVFGVLHSGWKGTGIIKTALQKAEEEFGTRAEDVCAVLGPHIRSCCYIVDEERANYFAENFTPDCVEAAGTLNCNGTLNCGAPSARENFSGKKMFRLSLEKANLNILQKCGVPACNIALCTDCTCCSVLTEECDNGRVDEPSGLRESIEARGQNCNSRVAPEYVFGSFRRETSRLDPDLPMDERWKYFTVQAAFCGHLA